MGLQFFHPFAALGGIGNLLGAVTFVQRQGPETWFGITGMCCFLPFGLIGIATTVFWLWTLIDCLSKEPSQGNEKLIWALIILFAHFLGALLYFFIRRPQRIKEFGQ